MKNYVDSIEKVTEDNKNYLNVLFTGKHAQLVAMTLQPGEEIGEEKHPDTDQFFRVEEGSASFVLNGEEHKVGEGGGVVITAGTRHNVINPSKSKALKLYTVYTKPEHEDKATFKTKAAAEAAEGK